MGNIWAHSQRHAHTEEHGHKYRHVWLLHQGGLPLTPQKQSGSLSANKPVSKSKQELIRSVESASDSRYYNYLNHDG